MFESDAVIALHANIDLTERALSELNFHVWTYVQMGQLRVVHVQGAPDVEHCDKSLKQFVSPGSWTSLRTNECKIGDSFSTTWHRCLHYASLPACVMVDKIRCNAAQLVEWDVPVKNKNDTDTDAHSAKQLLDNRQSSELPARRHYVDGNVHHRKQRVRCNNAIHSSSHR